MPPKSNSRHVSFFKEDIPWLYEIGIETYRELKSAKTISEKKKLIFNFENSFDMLGHPMMMEFSGKSEDFFMMNKEIRHSMHRYLDKYLGLDKGKGPIS